MPVTIRGDLPHLTPHLAKVTVQEVQNVSISPTGARLLAEARGDIFTIPAEKGDTRNLTRTPGVGRARPRMVAGRKIDCLFQRCLGRVSALRARSGRLAAAKSHRSRARMPSFFYAPHWSPDSKRIAFTDKHLRIWYVDVAGGKPVKIDTGLRGGFDAPIELGWSPDSQWIAYSRDLESQMHAIFVYSLATHTSKQITDGMSNAAHPVFDRSGKHPVLHRLDEQWAFGCRHRPLLARSRHHQQRLCRRTVAQWRIADSPRERR